MSIINHIKIISLIWLIIPLNGNIISVPNQDQNKIQNVEAFSPQIDIIDIKSIDGVTYSLMDNQGNIYYWGENIAPTVDFFTGVMTNYTPQKVGCDAIRLLSSIWETSDHKFKRYNILTNTIEDATISDSMNETDFSLGEDACLWWKNVDNTNLCTSQLLSEDVISYSVSPPRPGKYYTVAFLKKDSSLWAAHLNYEKNVDKPIAAVKVLEDIKSFSLNGSNLCAIDSKDDAWTVENLYSIYSESVSTVKVLNEVKAICCNFESIGFVSKDGTIWMMGEIVGQPLEHTLLISPMERADFPVQVFWNERANIGAGRSRMKDFLTQDSFGKSQEIHQNALNKSTRKYYLTYFRDCFTSEEIYIVKKEVVKNILSTAHGRFLNISCFVYTFGRLCPFILL